MFCKKCGMRLEKKDEVCRKCGEPRENSAFCGGFWGLTGADPKDFFEKSNPNLQDLPTGRLEYSEQSSFPMRFSAYQDYEETIPQKVMLDGQDKMIKELREEVIRLRRQRIVLLLFAAAAVLGLLALGILYLFRGNDHETVADSGKTVTETISTVETYSDKDFSQMHGNCLEDSGLEHSESINQEPSMSISAMESNDRNASEDGRTDIDMENAGDEGVGNDGRTTIDSEISGNGDVRNGEGGDTDIEAN